MNDLPQRKNIRLKQYDYSQSGYYFVTICTQARQNLFGEIIDGQMILNKYGQLVQDEWVKSADIRQEIIIDKFVVMPNHFHAILVIERPIVGSYGHTTDDCNVGNENGPYIHTPLQSPSKTLGAMIRGFKSSVTTKINILRYKHRNPVWQRGYHDHIIRNEQSYQKIYEYIQNNPTRGQRINITVGDNLKNLYIVLFQSYYIIKEKCPSILMSIFSFLKSILQPSIRMYPLFFLTESQL